MLFRSVNLIDFPIKHGRRPRVIDRVSDDVICWTTTHKIGYGKLQKLPNPNPLKIVRNHAGSSIPVPITEEMLFGQRAELNSFGPVLKENDVYRARTWALASGHTFYTYPHYDGAGFCTYSLLTTGTKVWSYLVMSGNLGVGTREASKANIKLANACGPTEYTSAPDIVPNLATPSNVFLTPGTVL